MIEVSLYQCGTMLRWRECIYKGGLKIALLRLGGFILTGCLHDPTKETDL